MSNDKATSDLEVLLAANAHNAWARWTNYLLNQCSLNDDGSMTIPAASVKRWKQQIATNYDDLTVEEQVSDIRESDLILQIFAMAQKGQADATFL